MTVKKQVSFNYAKRNEIIPVDLTGSFEYSITNTGLYTVMYGWDKDTVPDIPLDPGDLHTHSCSPGDTWGHMLYIGFDNNGSSVRLMISNTDNTQN